MSRRRRAGRPLRTRPRGPTAPDGSPERVPIALAAPMTTTHPASAVRAATRTRRAIHGSTGSIHPRSVAMAPSVKPATHAGACPSPRCQRSSPRGTTNRTTSVASATMVATVTSCQARSGIAPVVRRGHTVRTMAYTAEKSRSTPRNHVGPTQSFSRERPRREDAGNEEEQRHPEQRAHHLQQDGQGQRRFADVRFVEDPCPHPGPSHRGVSHDHADHEHHLEVVGVGVTRSHPRAGRAVPQRYHPATSVHLRQAHRSTVRVAGGGTKVTNLRASTLSGRGGAGGVALPGRHVEGVRGLLRCLIAAVRVAVGWTATREAGGDGS